MERFQYDERRQYDVHRSSQIAGNVPQDYEMSSRMISYSKHRNIFNMWNCSKSAHIYEVHSINVSLIGWLIEFDWVEVLRLYRPYLVIWAPNTRLTKNHSKDRKEGTDKDNRKVRNRRSNQSAHSTTRFPSLVAFNVQVQIVY